MKLVSFIGKYKKLHFCMVGWGLLLTLSGEALAQRRPSPQTSRDQVNRRYAPYDNYDAPGYISQELLDAAREGNSIAGFFNSPGVVGSNVESTQFCQEGFESYLRMRGVGNQEDPTSAWAGNGNKCRPQNFANFVCNRDYEKFRRDRENYEYNLQVRAAAVRSARHGGDNDPQGSGYRAISQFYNAETDTCVCANTANQCTGSSARASETVSNRPARAFDARGAAIDPDTASSTDCVEARSVFHTFVQNSYATPQFQQALQNQINASPAMANAREDLRSLQENLIATLQSNTTPGSVQAAALARMIQNIRNVEIATPEGNACVGDDENVMTVRRPGGGLRLFICPRAMLGANARQPLQAALANALGHAIDSCALEQMRVADSATPGAAGAAPLVSLARMGDGLRACLAENYLRSPRLPAVSASPSYVGVLGTEMSGVFSRNSTNPNAEQERLAFLNNPATGSHCTRSRLNNSNSGAIDNSGRGIQTNALEAQYWGTRALSRMLASGNQASGTTRAARTARSLASFGMQEDDRQGWDRFCNNAYVNAASEKRKCLSLSRSPAFRDSFHLRNTYGPLCRDMRRTRMPASSGNYPDSQVLFEVAASDPQLQELMGCTARDIVPTVNQSQLFASAPAPAPRGRHGRRPRARGPQPGHCDSARYMTEGLDQVASAEASPRNASREQVAAVLPARRAGASGGTNGNGNGNGNGNSNPGTSANAGPAVNAPATATPLATTTGSVPPAGTTAAGGAGQGQGAPAGGSAANGGTPAVTGTTGTTGTSGTTGTTGTTGTAGGAAPAAPTVATGTGSGAAPTATAQSAAATATGAASGPATNANAAPGSGAAPGGDGAQASGGAPAAQRASPVLATTNSGVRQASPVQEAPSLAVPQNAAPVLSDLRRQSRVFATQGPSTTCRGNENPDRCAEPAGITEDGLLLRRFDGRAASADGANCDGGQPCYCVTNLTPYGSYRCQSGVPTIPIGTEIPPYRQIFPRDLYNEDGVLMGHSYLIPGGYLALSGGAGVGIVYWPLECMDGVRTCNSSEAFVRKPGVNPRPASQGAAAGLTPVSANDRARIQVAPSGSEVPFLRPRHVCEAQGPNIQHPPHATNPSFFVPVTVTGSYNDGSGCRYDCSVAEGQPCPLINEGSTVATTPPPPGSVVAP